MKLEAKFLVPETNMADENVEADAQNNTLLRNITLTNTGNHPHTQNVNLISIRSVTIPVVPNSAAKVSKTSFNTIVIIGVSNVK